MAGRQVRVAVARIDALRLDAARRRLGPRDRRRYSGFRSRKRQREFLAGRALLQQFGLKFDSAPDGGIRAQGRAGASVSHARGWVACVIVASGRAGIDIEPMIERDFDKLGEWAFGKKAVSREEFYRRWTRYEARIKAFGDDKPRGSHRERSWMIGDRATVSVCVPARALLGLDVRFLDDLRPFRPLRASRIGQRLRRAADRVGA